MNFKKEMEKIMEFRTEINMENLIRGIDHIAYRVRTGDREKAVLEFMRLAPYFHWKSYTIETEQAITTVLRHDESLYDIHEMPAIVISEGLKKSTIVATYVKEFGPRVHHTAYRTNDITQVVKAQKAAGIRFTSNHIIGDEKKGLLQIFTKPSVLTLEITEYIQRFGDFDGFFLLDNVGALMRSTKNLNKPSKRK